MIVTSIVNGWQIRAMAGGGFAVWDMHGLISGPFGTAEQAMAAALRLPLPLSRLFGLEGRSAVAWRPRDLLASA